MKDNGCLFNCLAALIGGILAAITVMAILIYRYGL